MRALRAAAGAAIIVTAALALTGCSSSGSEGDPPERLKTPAATTAPSNEPKPDPTTGGDPEPTVGPDEVDVFSLRVGDCLDDTDISGSEVETVPGWPCSEAHNSEIYASTMMTDASYPGDEAAATQADEFCYAEFETFVGLSYDESVLDIWYLTPSQETWDGIDDREILCMVKDSAGGLTATLRGAAR